MSEDEAADSSERASVGLAKTDVGLVRQERTSFSIRALYAHERAALSNTSVHVRTMLIQSVVTNEGGRRDAEKSRGRREHLLKKCMA